MYRWVTTPSAVHRFFSIGAIRTRFLSSSEPIAPGVNRSSNAERGTEPEARTGLLMTHPALLGRHQDLDVVALRVKQSVEAVLDRARELDLAGHDALGGKTAGG